MKLNEFIRHFSFDAIIPELVIQDPKAATQLAWYKEAYDTLLETKPDDEGWEIEVIRSRDEYDDGSYQEYVHARHCEGQPWEGYLASEVIIKDHIPEISCPRIPAMRALPVVAPAIPVIEGHLTHGAVGVNNQH